jgi:acyl-CoA reductase-like NAD-dependent aldehyde dehydrogenase
MQTKLHIAGARVPAAEGGMLAVIDPAAGEVFHHIRGRHRARRGGAVKATREAFDHMTGPERAKHLRAVAQGIRR